MFSALSLPLYTQYSHANISSCSINLPRADDMQFMQICCWLWFFHNKQSAFYQFTQRAEVVRCNEALICTHKWQTSGKFWWIFFLIYWKSSLCTKIFILLFLVLDCNLVLKICLNLPRWHYFSTFSSVLVISLF